MENSNIYTALYVSIQNEMEYFLLEELKTQKSLQKQLEALKEKQIKIKRSKKTSRFDVENINNSIKKVAEEIRKAKDLYFEKKRELQGIVDVKVAMLEELIAKAKV